MNEMDSKQIKSVFSRVGWGVALFMVVTQVLSGIIYGAATVINPDIVETGWFLWVASYIPLYFVAFPILYFVIRTIPTREANVPEPITLSAGKMAKWVIICIGITYVLNILSTLILTLISMITGNGVTNPLATAIENSNPFLTILVVVIIAPIMEEIVFRRFMYDKLMVFGPKVYILVSSFLFAMFHANINQLLYAFILGMVFAGMTYYTGTIKYSMILHIIINFIGSGVLTLIMAFTDNNEAIMGMWTMVIMVMMVIGVIVGILWLVKNHKNLSFERPAVEILDKKMIFANLGMIVYIIVIAFLIVSALLVG